MHYGLGAGPTGCLKDTYTIQLVTTLLPFLKLFSSKYGRQFQFNVCQTGHAVFFIKKEVKAKNSFIYLLTYSMVQSPS